MKRIRFVEMLAVAVVLSVLSLNASGSTFQVIYNFTGGQDGGSPVDAGNLAFDANGNLYGTTEFGGACGQGTFFELSPNGGSWAETVLHSFCGGPNDGALPTAAPVFTTGVLFGTTTLGGSSNEGTDYAYFFLPYFGTYSTLCSSCFLPYASPSDFPLTTWESSPWYAYFAGGANGRGTFIGNGVNYDFCSLPSCADGANPAAAVAVDASGDGYGTTIVGGANNQGVVYECVPQVDSSGQFLSGLTCSVLHSFAGGTNDGANPLLATPLLTQACGPNLCTQTIWGTTPLGGAFGEVIGGYGTVWSINQLAGFNLLHSFDRIDGAWPYAGLTNLNGTFYGTTSGGGPLQRECCPLRFKAGRGTIYSLTSSGTLTTLHTFTGSDGALPYSGLVADSSGNLYGVTFSGGTYNSGVVYEITP